jgi:imidazolonepropionase-like amidohydrolase
MTVVVRGERIQRVDADSNVAIAAAARVIDGHGLWLIPGLVETRTHRTDPGALRAALALGVTAALVIWTGDGPAPAIERASMQPDSRLPRVHLVGGRFSAEFPGRFVPGAPRFAAPSTAREVESALDALARTGVQRIKIWQDDGVVWSGPEDPMLTLSAAIVRDLVNGAKRRRMKVYLHAWQLRDFRAAVTLSPDAIIHPVMDAPLATTDVEALKRARFPWVTTMAQLLYFGDRSGYARRIVSDARLTAGLSAGVVASLEHDAATTTFPDLAALVPAVTRNVAQHLQYIRENTDRVVAAQVPLAVGSDRPVGYGTHLEMALLAEGGLAPATVLKAATIGGALLLDQSTDFGTISTGKVADLVHLWSRSDLLAQ